MKKYYVDGMRISEEQAKQIEKDNQKYLQSGDFNQWQKIKYIVETKD